MIKYKSIRFRLQKTNVQSALNYLEKKMPAKSFQLATGRSTLTLSIGGATSLEVIPSYDTGTSWKASLRTEDISNGMIYLGDETTPRDARHADLWFSASEVASLIEEHLSSDVAMLLTSSSFKEFVLKNKSKQKALAS